MKHNVAVSALLVLSILGQSYAKFELANKDPAYSSQAPDSTGVSSPTTNMASLPIQYGMASSVVNLGINPKTAFENMRQYMTDVENAFDIMLTRLNMQRGRLVSASLANEKEEEELNYRKKIMDKLNIDFVAEKAQLKADDDKEVAVEAKLKAIKEKNRLLGVATSEEERRTQEELDKLQKSKDQLANLEISWKNTELTLNSRFQIQAAELQQLRQKIAEDAGELKYMKKVLSKYKIDFDTEKAILAKEDLMMQHLVEKMAMQEQELKKHNELLRQLTKAGTDSERKRLKEKYLQESEILRNKGSMEAAMKTLNEQLSKLEKNKDALSADQVTMAELQKKLNDILTNDQSAKISARIAEIETRHRAALDELAAKYETLLTQKKNDASTLKSQADSQASQISSLEAQVNGLKDVYSDHYSHAVGSPCNNPPPCLVAAKTSCGCNADLDLTGPVKHIIVSSAHAAVPDTLAVDFSESHQDADPSL
eukprot:c20607_g1_i1.p1 GENE.c20607_g1_i1~~c20607_g1_i1.p1  ORF type:complete len:483 (+),score=124.49 c20607_g1_i1:49-1497(+)